MMDYVFKDVLLDSEINDVKKLLEKNNLTYEDNVTKTIGLYDKKKLIATGSVDHNVIKMIAVDSDYQSKNLSAKVLSHLLFDLEAHHIDHYFLFTKPENKNVFSNFSLKVIIENDDVVLYENKEQDIAENLENLKKQLPKKKGTRGAIVMNLNPMTLGHLHLIETALKKHNDLLIFLVETDASIIDYQTRYSMLKKTISHLKNVYVLPSTPYMISHATFPTYFLKDQLKIEVYTKLDVSIFEKYFIPIFEIDVRHVGKEPLDPMTNQYNEMMKKILGNQLNVIDRKTFNQKVISASYVRELAKKEDYNAIKQIVPKATYKFLISKKVENYFMNDQILDAREQRFQIIKELSKKHNILISLKANTPGQDKNRYSSYFLINQFDSILKKSFDFSNKYVYNGFDGPYYIYAINRDIVEALKKELIYIEDHHFLGRLIDLDLYVKGEMISRENYQIKQRICMLCEQSAFNCIKSNAHTTMDIISYIDSKIQNYLTKHLTKMLDKSILQELNLEHKFGLVTPSSKGSHHDMDYELMLKSKDVILPFLIDIFILGFTHNHDDQLYHKARALGLKAELSMLEKTNQINTYKGLIYLLGFILLSIAHLIKNHIPFEHIFSHIKYLAKDVMLDFNEDPQTTGLKSFLEHQLTGIRGEVFKGLPTIQKAFNYFSDIDTFDQRHQHHLLLFFIQHSEDTVLLKRSGSLSNYHHYKQMASQVNPYVDKDIKSFTSYCINNHVSFGGSADLFVVFHFLKHFKQFYL